MTASVKLQGIVKRHGATTVLHGIDLEIRPGEFFVLLGPSGSGKTTTLRILAGLESVSAGTVTMDGADVTSREPGERDVAMVFQSYALYPHMTVRQNLGFGLRMRGVSAPDVASAVEKTAGMLGIGELLDRRPAQLSGGQRQRVALGRALARRARAYLLDEPLSNLDPLLRVDTRSELALLHQQLGLTMMYVTHDQEEAMTLGSRIAVMQAGMVEQVGRPLDVYRYPANRFVASFIGSPRVNLCACTGARSSANWSLASPLFVQPLVLPTFDGELPPRVEVGFRPQDIELRATDEAHVVGRIILIEPLGPATLLHLRVDSTPDAALRLVVPADTVVRHGELLGFRIRIDRLHVFDSATGRRLVELPPSDAGPAKMAPEHR